MSVFEDQEKFMRAGDQSIGAYNEEQYEMYINLIHEEYDELVEAKADGNRKEQLDALLDLMVVTLGALHSFGADVELAWNEVVRSNNSKIHPITGKVIKRDDGKIMKPDTYSPPNLIPFIHSVV